jgi:Tfp pilus assembly protein PilN
MMQQINLYRPIFRKQEKKFSSMAMMQAGGVIVAAMVLLYVFVAWRVHVLQGKLAHSEALRQTAQARLDETTLRVGTGGQSKAAEERIADLQKQIEARQRVREVINRGMFTNTAGYSDFFVAFARQRISSVWLTGFDIVGAGESMRLQGRTVDPAQVPRYMQRLAGEKVLVGKEFQVFVMSRPKKKDDELVDPTYIEFMLQTTPTKAAEKS